MDTISYDSLAKPATALVTGASAGLGRALALELQARGYEVLAAGRQEDALRALGAAGTYCVDLSAPGGAEKLWEQVTAQGRRVDLLVCNAGMGICGPFVKQDPAALSQLMELNMAALTRLNRLFLPQMVERGRGGVLNVASTGAWQPGPYTAAYYASKAYVLSLTRALREELRGSGVTVTALCPGAVATEFSRRAGRQDPQNAAPPEKIAKAAVDGLLKGRGLVVPGFSNKALHLCTKLLPAPLMARFVAGYQKNLIKKR